MGIVRPQPRAVIALFALGLVLHGLRAGLLREPDYWDLHYYRGLARHVAAGEGAVSGAVWSLLHLPETLPGPADLYWLPLPSRALVPGLLLWPAGGDLLVTVVVAATWGPLAYALALRLGASRREAVGAGLAALLGGVWSRSASLPDSFGLAGALGGAAFLALAHLAARTDALGSARGGRALLALVACGAAFALTRSEGAALGLLLATGLRGWRSLAVAASGLLASLGWTLRNVGLVGEDAIALRAATARARSIEELLLGAPPPSLGLLERLESLANQLPSLLVYWVASSGLLGLVAVLAGLPRARAVRLPFLLAWLALPPLTVLAAPGAAAHGALYRTGAALAPALAAIGALGAGRLVAWGQAKRGYHPAFLPALLLGSLVLVSAWFAVVRPGQALPPTLCAPLAGVPEGAPVLAWNPSAIEAYCVHPAVLLPRGIAPERLADLVARYDLQYAVLPPAGWERPGVPGPADMGHLLPGWRQVGEDLWASPIARPRFYD